MDFPLGHRDALEDREGVLFHERREIAPPDERANFRVAAAVRVFVGMVMLLLMALVRVFVLVMFVTVGMRVRAVFRVPRSAFRVFLVRFSLVDAELHALDALPLLALEVHVEVAEVELRQLPFERGGLHAEVAQRTDSHVAADAGDAVEEENFHGRGL